MDKMAKTNQWLLDNDPLHATSAFHGNIFEYKSATLRNISLSGLVSLFCQLGLSLVVLMLATRNWCVSLLAFASIVANTCWSLSFMYIVGWSFGILESICVTILVGEPPTVASTAPASVVPTALIALNTTAIDTL